MTTAPRAPRLTAAQDIAHQLVCTGRPLSYGEKEERTWVCKCGEASYYGFDTPVFKAHRAHRKEVALAAQAV